MLIFSLQKKQACRLLPRLMPVNEKDLLDGVPYPTYVVVIAIQCRVAGDLLDGVPYPTYVVAIAVQCRVLGILRKRMNNNA